MTRSAVGRPLFTPHRQASYVATRPFSWKGVTLEAGEDIPTWPVYHLRHLHNQGMIGPEGHPWTGQRIASWAKRIADGQAKAKAKAQHRVVKLEEVAEQADKDALEAMETAEESRSLMERLTGFLGGGEPDGGPTGASDPA